jgi:hypothetical protein
VRVYFTDGGIADGYIDTATGTVMLYDDHWNDGKAGGKTAHTLKILGGGQSILLSRSFSVNPATDPVELAVNAQGKLEFRAPAPNPNDSNAPYTPIDTAGELALIGRDAGTLGGAYLLMRNLDLLGVPESGASVLVPPPHNWQPLGDAAAKFTGKFDGNGQNIEHLYINAPGGDNVGLFGYTQNAAIKDVTLVSCDVTGRDNVGGVAGHATSSIISGCAKSGGSVQALAGTYGDIAGLED